MSDARSLETRLIHAGEPSPRIGGAANVPIFTSTVYECAGGTTYAEIPYPRLNNLPNHRVLADKLAALEGAEAAVVTASGMAAISTTLLQVARGGHLLVQDCLYGGTQALVTGDLPAFGIAHDVISAEDPASWAAVLRPDTKAIYVEAMTNPTLQVIDHDAVVAFAKQHGLVSIIDATFATPVNYRPSEHGYDLSLHSATKYLNGHSDLVAGAVIGRRELVEGVLGLLNHLGGCLPPHACYMLYRGLRTLAVRVRYQNDSALALAEALERHPAVARVNYPGLESHPHRARAGELFDGFGGMLSFELRESGAVPSFLEGLTLPILGPSLGGPETLITQPAKTSHLGQSPAERERMGVTDGLLRVSVGLEATGDLIDDFTRALDGVAKVPPGGMS